MPTIPVTIPFTVGKSVASPFGDRLIEHLEPWTETSEDLERVCVAIGAMGFDALLELVEEEGSEGEPGWVPAWGRLLNVELCPGKYLPFLAQWVGVEVPKGASEEEARSLIREQPARLRGTLGSIETAIRRSLTGEKAFKVVERRNAANEEDAYHFLIIIYSEAELPSQVVLEANVNAVKPAGVFYTIIVGDLTYAVLEAAHTTYAELEAAHTTYADMEAHPTN